MLSCKTLTCYRDLVFFWTGSHPLILAKTESVISCIVPCLSLNNNPDPFSCFSFFCNVGNRRADENISFSSERHDQVFKGSLPVLLYRLEACHCKKKSLHLVHMKFLHVIFWFVFLKNKLLHSFVQQNVSYLRLLHQERVHSATYVEMRYSHKLQYQCYSLHKSHVPMLTRTRPQSVF